MTASRLVLGTASLAQHVGDGWSDLRGADLTNFDAFIIDLSKY